jgi:hypothetical protein
MEIINVTDEIIEINVTEEVINIQAPTGAYPLPNAVNSVFGRVGNVVAAEGDYTLTQLGDVTIATPSNGQVLRYNGTTWVNATESFAGTVTSVNMSVPTGLTISGNPITISGTLAVGLGAGYVIPTQATLDAKQDDLNGTGIVKSTAGTITYLSDNTANWNTAYNDSIVSASVTGTATKTLTLNQQDGGSVTASWTDTDTGLTSVGLSMPSAFSVANSPLTANGTLSVTGAGTTAQYVRGDGSLATFPTIAQEAQRLITEVYNSTGATLTKGTVVYINGGQGNLPTVTKAIATGDATSAQTYGVVQSDITNMNNGFVVAMGSLTNLDTQIYPVGTQLYLSATTAGAWTSVKQYAPNHLVYVGIVVRSHPTQGVVEIRIQNGYELDELHDVSAQNPTNGDILQYVSATDLWTKVAGTTTNIAEGTRLYFTDARARAAITLTTTGTSGAATYTSGVLNIPQYQGVLTNPVTGTGTTNTLPKFTGASTIGNSNITDTGSLITLGSNSYINGALGIGTTSITSGNVNLFLARNLTGDVNVFSVNTESVIQSDVTTHARYFRTAASTAAASFTLSELSHYEARQGTFGAGSAVGTQQGFVAGSSLVGATNNFGFRGRIPAATNRWNLFMDGTADNYMAGSLGIGSTSLTGYTLRNSKNITGASLSIAYASEGSVQSDVTIAQGYRSVIATQATAFTLTNLQHFVAGQGTFGAGSTVTNQYAFFADSGLISATNNFGFYGNLTSSGSSRWNLYMNGTAPNYLNGVLNIGTTTLSGFNLDVNGTGRFESQLTIGSNSGLGLDLISVISTALPTSSLKSVIGSLNSGFGYAAGTLYLQPRTGVTAPLILGTEGSPRLTIASTGAATFTSSVTAASFIPTSSTIPTNGMYLSGTNTLGFATNGTLDMTLDANGALGLGTTSLTGYSLRINRNPTGATTSYGVTFEGTIQSDVTTGFVGYRTNIATLATTFTTGFLVHYSANQSTFGAGSTVSNQYGFIVESNVIGATNNFGFFGNIAAGTNRWNLYMNGTANNYLAGSLGIGTTSFVFGGGTYNLNLTKNITGTVVAGGMNIGSIINSDVTSAAIGLNVQVTTAAAAFTLNQLRHISVNQTTLGVGSSVSNQYGIYVDQITNGSSNFGFFGNVPSGTNRWNLYMAGTAANFMAGTLSIGGTTINSNTLLQINANENAPRLIVISNPNSGISSQAGLQLTSETGTASFNAYSSTFGTPDLQSSSLLSSGVLANGLVITTATTSPIRLRTNSIERVRIKQTGQMRFVPLTADPSGAEAGDIYYNSTISALKLYDGTVWRTITVV